MLGIYLFCKSKQVLRRVIGHVRSQFDLHESVFAVMQANDGIDFLAVFIHEMVYIDDDSLGSKKTQHVSHSR